VVGHGDPVWRQRWAASGLAQVGGGLGRARPRLYRGGADALGVPSTPAEGRRRHGQAGLGCRAPMGSAGPERAEAGRAFGLGPLG
jgi:hypothetical protein